MKSRIAAGLAAGMIAAALTACGSNDADAGSPPTDAGAPSSALADAVSPAVPEGSAVDKPGPQTGPTVDGKARTELTMPLNSTLDLGAQTNGDPVKVPVTYESVACQEVWPGLDMDWDAMVEVDAVADPGKQLCIVRLAVNNTSNVPISFISTGDLELKASNGNQYSEWDGSFSPGGYANSEGVGYAGDTDAVQPGDTEYDFTMFEIPATATPDVLKVWDWLPVGQGIQSYPTPTAMDVN